MHCKAWFPYTNFPDRLDRRNSRRCRGHVVRGLDLQSGGPGFKPSTVLFTGFVLGCPEFNSLAPCIKPTGFPPASWNF